MARGAFVRRAVGLAMVAIALPACGDKLVRLGSKAPAPFHFGTPTLVPELSSPARTDNPTLTADMLEIYFTTNRDSASGGDVWWAERTSTSEPFGAPAPVPGINSDTFETSSAISRDGLSLWFGSDRPGGTGSTDIWESQRDTRGSAWSAPLNLVGLNTTAADIPRPPGLHDLVMPMASTKVTPANPAEGNYQTYWATRPNLGAPFTAPVAIPELDFQDRSTVDGFLTDDGLTFFFSSSAAHQTTPDGGGALDAGPTTDAGATSSSDLFVAFRRGTSEPFTVTQPLSDLNTSYDERDPWLSPDGRTFYFTSDRDGVLNIYVVSVEPR